MPTSHFDPDPHTSALDDDNDRCDQDQDDDQPPSPGRDRRRRTWRHGELKPGSGSGPEPDIPVPFGPRRRAGHHQIGGVAARPGVPWHVQLQRNLGRLGRGELRALTGGLDPGSRHAPVAAGARYQALDLDSNRLGFGAGVNHVQRRQRVAATWVRDTLKQHRIGLDADPDTGVSRSREPQRHARDQDERECRPN
jgi:hypothetical protein